jgi:hypothetical protein
VLLIVPLVIYFLLVLAVLAVFVLIGVGGIIRVVGDSLLSKSRAREMPALPPFEPYTVYIPLPGCSNCGMSFQEESEHFCKWCGNLRTYQEIEITGKDDWDD